MNWTKTTTCSLRVLLYKCEWLITCFCIILSLLSLCIKNCACFLKDMSAVLGAWHPILQNCNKIKYLNSICWLALAYRVKELITGTMCDNDSHSPTYYTEIHHPSHQTPPFSTIPMYSAPWQKHSSPISKTCLFPSFFHQSDYKFWVVNSIYHFSSVSSSPSFPTFPHCVTLIRFSQGWEYPHDTTAAATSSLQAYSARDTGSKKKHWTAVFAAPNTKATCKATLYL